MTREADHLRAELIEAKGLLAEAAGLLEAADEYGLDCVADWRARRDAFSTRPVAVLPAGTKPCECHHD